MKPTTVVTALKLASRRRGATAAELAHAVGCPLRTARHALRSMALDGLLMAEVPERKGKRLGDWRIVYRMAKVR